MRVSILILLVLYACIGKNQSDNSFIKIENVGPHDKTITTLLISVKDVQPREFEKVIVVNKESLDKIQNFIIELKDNLKLDLEKKEAKYDWDAFRITSISPEGELVVITSNKAESIAFFTGLTNKLLFIEREKEMKILLNELEVLSKRIGP